MKNWLKWGVLSGLILSVLLFVKIFVEVNEETLPPSFQTVIISVLIISFCCIGISLIVNSLIIKWKTSNFFYKLIAILLIVLILIFLFVYIFIIDGLYPFPIVRYE